MILKICFDYRSRRGVRTEGQGWQWRANQVAKLTVFQVQPSR